MSYEKYQNDLDILKNVIGDTNSYPVLVALVELQMLLDKIKGNEDCNE